MTAKAGKRPACTDVPANLDRSNLALDYVKRQLQ